MLVLCLYVFVLFTYLSSSRSNTTLLMMSSVFRKRWISSSTFCLIRQTYGGKHINTEDNVFFFNTCF